MAFHLFTSLLLAVLGSSLIQAVQSSPAPANSEYPPYDYGVNRSTIIKRQSSSFYPITGVFTGNGPNGSPPQRLEIRKLENNNSAMWTLYILGLDMMQYTSQSDMLSWYQIMGIHGRPFLPFDNVQATNGNQNHGYCTHVSILFPTWHRPYLALFEQVMHNIIQQIAAQYPAGPVQGEYVAAAANFRIPYWDWAASPPPGQSVFPMSVGGSPSILVDGPAGSQLIANPLFSYLFKPLNPQDLPDPPFNLYTQTVRYPTSQDASAVSQNNLVAQQLDNNAASLRSRLYNLLTNYHDYDTFSNEAWIPSVNPAGFDSIESVHDQIHGLTGNGGHMSYIDYSAFDPAFMLHHANVDRIFAMWQAINPDSYVVPEPATFSTFTISAGQVEDGTSPLTPFQDPTGEFWTSNAVENTASFGYVYPETSNSTGADIRGQVISAVNQLYGPSSTSGSLSNLFSNFRRRDIISNGTESTHEPSGSSVKFGEAASQILKTSIQYQEWIANILVKKHALSGPFFIHIFLGPFGPDSSRWSFEPNLVGTHSIFDKASTSISNASFCNCSKDFVMGTIPLTPSLSKEIASGNLKSLGVEDVEPYLAKNLKYRISLPNDTEVDNSKVPSLKISVVSADVEKPASDSELPHWGEMRGHFDISQ